MKNEIMESTRCRRVLLIINPVSGKMKSKSGLYDMLDELYRLPDGTPDTGRLVTVCPTMYRGHAVELAAGAADSGFDEVICCGGDGTLNETVNGVMSIEQARRPALGYVPSGSTNDFAFSMGIPAALRPAARVAGGAGGTVLDVGQFIPVDQTAEAHARFFSYIATFGAFSAASYSTPQGAKNVLGHMAYILAGIADIGNILPRQVSVELADGTATQGDYIFGAVTNTVSAGGVVKLPASEVSTSDGELEVILIHTPRNPTELNKIVTSLLASDYSGNPMIEFYHTPRAHFSMAEPLRWSLDGEEACGGTNIDIVCHTGAIWLKV